MSVRLEVTPQPLKEIIEAAYQKGNPGESISYTVRIELSDGTAKTLSLARRRFRMTTPPYEPTLMAVEIDELDGLIDLLVMTREELAGRGLKTEYVR